MSQTLFGFNKSHLITAAGLAGAAFIGYCIYFDYARRSAPDYKEKIRRNRREKAKARAGCTAAGRSSTVSSQLPDPTDSASMQAYFLQEVQLGEEAMACGNVEQGAIHIANAIALCGPSQQLLQIFQQTLPAEQYAAVIEQLPHTRARLAAIFGEAAESAESQRPAATCPVEDLPPAQENQNNELLDDIYDLE
ncbi:hypothetical protein KIN20_027854 [Parelaphostrongylus tenuis]|nr:hypothetical protein KIN20_027854 [Parelaphostrongylus tenuis]